MIKSNIILSIEFVEKYDSLTDKELLDATNKCNSGEYLDIVIYFHKLWNIDITTTNMFEIGKKIKCINTKNKYGEIVAEELKIGEKYQILSTTIINNYNGFKYSTFIPFCFANSISAATPLEFSHPGMVLHTRILSHLLRSTVQKSIQNPQSVGISLHSDRTCPYVIGEIATCPCATRSAAISVTVS